MIAPINGAFGHLDSDDAITLCAYHKLALFALCQCRNFAEHRGDPAGSGG
jgi:hypothetical protein